MVSADNLTEKKIPPTTGITVKVIKGSIWSLIGQILPLLASFIATPFVLRFLGPEGYGVLALIVLIPSYFSFTDLGMSIASTKFASEAYASGSREKESEIIRTAALIAFLSSSPVTLVLFIFSAYIISLLNIPENYQFEANWALKFAAVTFAVNILNGIFNTAQLTRLRMDLNTLISTGFRLFGIISTPVVLYYGGSVASATAILMLSSVLTLIGHICVSSRLLKELLEFSINKNVIKPLLKFGGALAVSGIAGILLVNLEKIVLVRATSVESLAYYSVAFTFANMATMFSSAMIQSLLPAFSQLLGPERKTELNKLFARSLRINILGLVPAMAFLFMIAKPFFTIWAGENFGRESSLPFYILLFGLFFNLTAYIPHSILMASGRTDILAKIYWIELFPYILITAFLTSKFGAVGAAMAWSLRVVVDAAIIIWFSKKLVGISLNVFDGKGLLISIILMILIAPVVILGILESKLIWVIPLLFINTATFFVIFWKSFLENEEKKLIMGKIYASIKR
jgi:O-antigen/teichoic acid export membrane protein